MPNAKYLQSMFYVTFKEFVGSKHLIDTLAVVPTAGDLVRGPGMTDIFNRTAQYLQAAVEHFALHEAGAPVILTMEDDQGGSNIGDIGNRRFALQDGFGGRFPGITAEIVGYEPPCIAFAEKGGQVIHAALRAGRFETVIVSYDPGGEIAGVGTTGDHQL